MDFTSKPGHWNEILHLIKTTPRGNSLIEALNPALNSGRVSFEPYPLEIIQKLRAAIGHDQPIGACFDTDGDHGTIHFDPSGSLGILAPFLVHEIAHALDPSLWAAAKKKLSKSAREKLLLKAEVNAFETQHRFVAQLKTIHPEYALFLERAYPKARILHERLTEQSIAKLYGYASH